MTHALKIPSPTLACILLAATVGPIRVDDFARRRVFRQGAMFIATAGPATGRRAAVERRGGNLRVTPLKREQLIEVITCGVPGKAMPHFDEEAYTDKRCYGVTEAELGRDTPALPPGSTLNKREIEAVADYLLAKVLGRGPVITREECEEAYGAGARECVRYPLKP
jgi:hypothetical protein